MDIQAELQELETAAQRISDGLEAIQIMVLGLDGVGSQYAGALSAIWKYLSDADLELKLGRSPLRHISTPLRFLISPLRSLPFPVFLI